MADDDTHSSSVEDRVRAAQVEARARHISHNVRCLECGHQSIEESAADIAVRLRKVHVHYPFPNCFHLLAPQLRFVSYFSLSYSAYR